MNKFIIPLRINKEDQLEEIELRLCLRSIERYSPGAEITIVGDNYSWLKNINYIKAGDSGRSKSVNTWEKLKKALQTLPDGEYNLISDDIILLKEFRPAGYYDKTLAERIVSAATKGRESQLMRTARIVGPMAKCYEVHAPQVLQSTAFLKSVGYYENSPHFPGSAYMTIYHNLNQNSHESIQTGNAALYKHEVLESRLIPFFSLGPSTDPRSFYYILSTFKRKSRYEK